MIILANFLVGIAGVLNQVLQLLIFIVIVSALISWVNPDPYNPIVKFLNAVTEPMFRFIRRYIPLLGGRIDLSPIVLILAIYFVQALVVGSLYDYGHRIKAEAVQAQPFAAP